MNSLEYPVQVSIYNSIGKLVYQNELLTEYTEIDSSGFRSGLHIVVLETDDSKASYQLMVD